MIFGKKPKTITGLDLGASSIKLVKLEDKGGSYSLEAVGIKEISTDLMVDDEIKDKDTLIFHIQSLIDQVDPKARDVAISIAGHGVITDRITMDQKSGDEAEQAILFEAEQRSPFDVEDVTVDYHIISTNPETHKMDVLLVAARNEFLKKYLDILLDAGLNPIIVDTDAFAILNSYEMNYEIDPQKVIALLNLGFDTTNVIFVKDGIYHSTRDISHGVRSIYEVIMKEFRLNTELALKTLKGEMESSIDQDMLKATVATSAEDLISGLEIAFSYFKASAGITDIDWMVLTGGGALVPFLPEYLQNKLSIPMEVGNPLRNIEYDTELFQEIEPEKIAPLLAVAVGLAARKVK
ncbi:MAG: type IV pilus assembly protein PilM [Candidatus Zixiibacteriota bacterium]